MEFIVPTMAAILGFIKSIRFVHEGELGVRLRFGKVWRDKNNVPIIIHPGFVFLIPFVDTLKRHHVRQQTMRLDDQRIVIKDGLIFVCEAVILYRVTDIYKAMFEIDDVDDSIEDIGMKCLRNVLQSCTHGDLSDFDKISSSLVDSIRVHTSNWGIEIIEFGLTSSAPTPESANLLNASIGVELKLLALEEACERRKINFKELDPLLAAVLVGMPLVASVTSKNGPTELTATPPSKDTDKGGVDRK
jgi:regulator of protease activity HflC (stomatin/prohibitin superfamily)